MTSGTQAWRFVLIFTLAAGMGCACLMSSEDAEAGAARPRVADKEVAAHIRQLGDNNFYEREAASKWLWEHGEAAYPALVKAAKGRDPEVVWRAEDILERLRSGVSAETPKDIAKLLTSCRAGEDRQRRRVIERFPWEKPEARKGLMRQYKFEPDAKSRQALVLAIRPRSPKARAFLTTCYKEEKDAETRKAIARALGPAIRPILTSLLMKEKTDEVERLLADAMSERSRELIYDWVALAALTGKLDAKIKGYEKKAEGGNKLAKEILTRLKRARGDEVRHTAPPPAAKNYSTRTNDAHWREMAAKRMKSPRGHLMNAAPAGKPKKKVYTFRDYAELAIYYRLAGEKKKAQEAVARMRAFIGKIPERWPSHPWHPIKAMVVADASDEAVDELLRQNSIRLALQVRKGQGRYAEADAMLRKLADDDREDTNEDRVYMAGCLLALGDKKRAARLAKLAAQELAVRDPENAEGQDLSARQRARLDLIPVLKELGKQKLCDGIAEAVAKTMKSRKINDSWVDRDAVATLSRAGYRDIASKALLHWAAQDRGGDSRQASAASRAGLRELAFKLCALDLQEIIDASRRDKGRAFHTHSYAMVKNTLENLFPKKQTAVSVCLDALVAPDDKTMTGANVVKSLRKTLEATQGADAFLAIVRNSEKKAPAGPAERASTLDFLAKACREVGQEREAKRLDRKSMAGSPSGALAMREGDRLREAGHWADAAEAYAKAWQAEQDGVMSPLRPPFGREAQLVASAGPLFLQGWSLVKAGKNTEGRRLMRLAKIVPLGNSISRLLLAESMDKLGLHKDADRQRELATRVGAEPDDPFEPDSEAPDLLGRGDWAGAERIYVDEVRQKLTSYGWQGMRKEIFGIATLPGLIEVREMLANGRVDQAMKIIRASLRVCPANMRIPVLLVHPLEKLGRKKEADEIFGVVFRALSERSRHHPKDGLIHNNLAWMCAVSARELDVALTHAKEATRLEPNRFSYLDTLAEVHFQRREFDKARAAARAAWVNAPFRRFIQRRFIEFSRPEAELRKDLGARPASVSMY